MAAATGPVRSFSVAGRGDAGLAVTYAFESWAAYLTASDRCTAAATSVVTKGARTAVLEEGEAACSRPSSCCGW